MEEIEKANNAIRSIAVDDSDGSGLSLRIWALRKKTLEDVLQLMKVGTE